MWDDLKHSIQNVIEGKFSILAKVCYQNGTSWWLFAIYGPVKRKNRSMFWEELDNLKATCLPNWILGGDFNVVIDGMGNFRQKSSYIQYEEIQLHKQLQFN